MVACAIQGSCSAPGLLRSLAAYGLLLIALCVFAKTAQANSIETIYYYEKDPTYDYYQILLRNALNITAAEYGAAAPKLYNPSNTEATEARGLSLLQQKRIQVVFLSASHTREANFRAVPIALEEGLLGLRLLMINQETQIQFDHIESHEQLRSDFLVGFNPLWGDYSIYQHNGFKLAPATKYNVLFKMLSSGRFDYFPRGLTEVWRELDEFKKQYPNLQVEKRFAFYYHYPVYFFVHKDNEQLALRLELGLNRLQEKGELERHFQQYYGESIARAELDKRQIIVLQNPQGSENPLLVKPSWWPAGMAFPGYQGDAVVTLNTP